MYRADFNDIDENGRLTVLLPTGAAHPVGTKIHLYDADGNDCQGILTAVAGRIATIELDWNTWDPESTSAEHFLCACGRHKPCRHCG